MTATRHHSKNTMFWRVDTKLKALGRDQRWIDFHRACGRCGLFFDDIDPIDDDGKSDVTDRARRSGYQAIAFRASQGSDRCYVQIFVARGTGADPIAAVIDAYRRAIEAGDAVQPGFEAIFDGAEYPQPVAAAPVTIDIMELIG